MQKNKKIKIVGIVILSFLILIFAYKVFQTHNSVPSPFSSPYVGGGQVGVNPSKKTTPQINDLNFTDNITGEISVYDFMNKMRDEGKINFTAKNYIGMGEFIVSINGVAVNQNYAWIYYVNGKEAGIGISNYKINPGDVVSWRYEKSNY